MELIVFVLIFCLPYILPSSVVVVYTGSASLLHNQMQE